MWCWNWSNFLSCIYVIFVIVLPYYEIFATQHSNYTRNNGKYGTGEKDWKKNYTTVVPSSSSYRDERFLSIFTVVKFANLECSSGANAGMCMTSTECTDSGGSRISSCAYGYGTCCYKALTCGSSTSQNVTWIRNDEYPSYRTSGQTCEYSIYWPSDTCQIRLDFDEFELSAPITIRAISAAAFENGKCTGDQFTVASGISSSSFTYLCGKKPTGAWHHYLDVYQATSPTVLKFSLSYSLTQNRRWNMKVTQIPCEQRIPQGCGQYYTGTAGDIYSFNWNNGMYLLYMQYSICFREEKGYCGYTFTDQDNSYIACSDTLRLPTNADSTTSSFPYCLLPGSDYPSSLTTGYNGPLTMYFQTLNTVASPLRGNSAKNPGFHFKWIANTC